ncbi:MAG: ABC transporter permease [Acidimicrobiales bacterium]|jgi:putative ABC transport system permease protein
MNLINGWGVAASLILVAVTIAVSVWRKLGLERSVAIATVRAVVQLLAVGVVLVPVLADDAPMFWAWIWVGLMIAIAVVVVRRRTGKLQHLRPGIVVALVAIAAPLAVSLAVVFGFGVLELAPFAIVPVSGILLGNTLPATVAGAVRLQDQITSERGQIEAMLALGFPPSEAIREQTRTSIRAALLPQIERTNVVGLIALPGAMTGMILAGVDPLEAVLTQIVVMFLILGGVALTVTTVTLALASKAFSEDMRLLK